MTEYQMLAADIFDRYPRADSYRLRMVFLKWRCILLDKDGKNVGEIMPYEDDATHREQHEKTAAFCKMLPIPDADKGGLPWQKRD